MANATAEQVDNNFEVDVALAIAYKNALLAESATPPPQCKRVTVAAHLSLPGWTDSLIKGGFDPTKRSFFLVEGLVYYLPPEAPEALLKASAGLMSPGSVLAGDILLNFIDTQPSFLETWRTRFTFDLPSEDAVKAMLQAAGLGDIVLTPSYTAFREPTIAPPKDTHLVFRGSLL